MLELKNISKQYNQTKVLDHLSICFPDTGMIGIQGKSGCGKSTLLYIMGMLDEDFEGKIFFNGQEIVDRQKFVTDHISFMMQNKDFISALTIKENIVLPCHICHIRYNASTLKRIVAQLDIQDLLSRFPHQLSGGQIKRASLAKALLKQSDILLCDEPTGALSHHQAQEVMKYLKKISQKTLVIIVSHDSQLLHTYCHHILTLENGQLHGKIEKSKSNFHFSLPPIKYHTLWFYPIRQIVHQRNKLVFLFLFQWIVIVAFFLIVTAIFGVFDAIEQSGQQAVLKNIFSIEKKDGTPFESMIRNENIAYVDYGYHLEQCQLIVANQDIEASRYFLPHQTAHISLLQGRMPENNLEILVSQPLYRQYHDQNITLKYQQKTFVLKVVGVLQKDLFSQNEIYFFNDFKNNIPELINNHEMIIESYSSHQKVVYESLSKNYIVYNDIQERIQSYQSLLTLAQIVAFIFIGMSLLISLLLLAIVESIIYYERKHDVAYLLSLGLTPLRLFILSLLEAVILSGIIASGGCLVSMVVYEYVNDVLKIQKYFSFSLLLKPILFSKYDLYFIIFMIYLFMGILSVLRPIVKMMKITKVDVLREE